MLSKFGKKVEVLRIRRGLKKFELARLMNKSPQNISKMLRVQTPRKATIKKLSRILKVSIKKLS